MCSYSQEDAAGNSWEERQGRARSWQLRRAQKGQFLVLPALMLCTVRDLCDLSDFSEETCCGVGKLQVEVCVV